MSNLATDLFGTIRNQIHPESDESIYENQLGALELQEYMQEWVGAEGYKLTSLFGPEIPLNEFGIPQSATNNFSYLAGLESLPPNFNYKRDDAVKDVFDGLVDDLVINDRWANNLRRYVYGFATRDNSHTEFFGSPFLGTHRVLFKTSDRVTFFRDIIDVDEVKLRDELIKTKWINKDYKVSSEAFNLSIVYLMHRVQISDLSKDKKKECLINLVMLFHYRIMTSIMNHYFGYLVKESLAKTTYNELSLKFDIKRYGSWNALFEARAEYIINKSTGIHYDTFTNMNNDKGIVYMINDMESRLKAVVNDYTAVLYKTKDQVDLVETESSLTMLDGELNVRDVQKQVNRYKNYISNVINEGTSFYKRELVTYAAKAIPRTDEDKLELIVREFPAQYSHAKGDKYREFVDDITSHLFEYMTNNKIRSNDLKTLLFKLRNAYTASKSTNALLHKLRKEGDEIIKVMTGIKTEIKVTSLRTSFMLYIVLRTLIMENTVR